MLEITIIREKTDWVKERLAVKGFRESELIDKCLAIDADRRQFQTEADAALAKSNEMSKEIGKLFQSGKKEEANQKRAEASNWKDESKKLVEQQQQAEQALQDLLVRIPNIPNKDVPHGLKPEDNVVVKEWGEIPDLKEKKPHWELAEEYEIFDLEAGVKVSGAGFPVFKGKGALLQRRLINLFLDEATKAGYKEIVAPLLVNETSGFATGNLPDKEGQMYEVAEDGLYLIPTAEVPITNLYRDELLNENELPIKLCGYTPCFRREAGSYGKDVRGLNRVHQFDKVEIVQLTNQENSYQTLDEMLDHVEGLLQKLELPYRILKLCGGDMTFTSSITYDFEVYSAAQEKWLEVSSVTNFETYQGNRLKCRYKDVNKKKRLVHTLNGSALALPRVIAALLENNQTEHGIKLPEILGVGF